MDIPKVFIYGVDVRESGSGQPPYEYFADIVFIDRSTKGIHPSVYQMKTQGNAPDEIREAGGLLMIGEVLSISRKHKKIFLADGNSVIYNYLVLVKESHATMFGNQSDREFSAALRTLAEALKLQQQIPHLFGTQLTLLDGKNPAKGNFSACTTPQHPLSVQAILSRQQSEGYSAMGDRDVDRLFEFVL